MRLLGALRSQCQVGRTDVPPAASRKQNFEFQWVRDYELTGLRQLTQEFVFSFDAGEDATDGEARVKPLSTAFRPKGVYYTPIETAKQLRKRRPNVSA